MDNYYNHLASKPALKSKHMPKGLEQLARTLVESGRFRVDTVTKQNFVRWGRPYEGVNMVFSHREIFDKELIPRTTEIMWKVFARHYPGSDIKKKVTEELERLRAESKRNIDVEYDIEISLARLIVQAAEPPVIQLLVLEGTEVFVSYSYSVGDMLDIQTWQDAGDSSGLQSTDHSGCAVFVSCGGNPLAKETLERPTDGFNAISRMLVIAGQELAHYSDIIRDGRRRGSRFSADVWYGRPSEVARTGRLADIENVLRLRRRAERIGLRFFTSAERSLKFYKEHRKWSLIVLRNKIKVWIYQAIFIILCKLSGQNYLKVFYKDEYMCSIISLMFDDMLFNLQPDADAYKRPDPIEEEMIMCIEALARVQQQANKWGREITRISYPNLYNLYYFEILPACIARIEKLSGHEFPEIFRRKY